MFAILVFALLALTPIALWMASSSALLVFASNESEIIRHDIAVYANAIRSFEISSPVASAGLLLPAELATRAGNEYLRHINHPLLDSERAGPLSDGGWRFQRVALWAMSPRLGGMTRADYLNATNNQCSTGVFYADPVWCGHGQSIWAVVDTKDLTAQRIMGERQRMTKTAAKLWRAYGADSEFAAGVANGSYNSLSFLTSEPGLTAANCTGVYMVAGVPLGCEDMFNAWGFPIMLQKINSQHVVLVNRTGVARQDGQVVRLAEEAYVR